ncbi:MAG: TetR/AcrR family transcriptional regulator [Actinobacteria bacterium]|nr:MAG: TetR/AcrR family transcriptional regulator [Actinomycetota bacterium]
MAAPDTATKPLRADARRNRQRVLDAAARCFAKDGMQAQMDDIAGCAKVGVGTVYRHFPTKEALVRALADDYFARQDELARAALEVRDPWEAFSGYIRGGANLLAENRALAETAAERPDLMQAAAFAASTERGFFETLETLIERAQSAGVLRPDFQLEDIPSIMCSLGSLQISRGQYANWRRILEMLLDGLRAGARNELPPPGASLPHP